MRRPSFLVACLFSCCVFLFILCSILLGALVLLYRQRATAVYKPHQLYPKPSAEKFRLPEDVRPMAYNLTLFPKLEDGTFEGNVDILIDVRSDVDSLVLHSKSLSIGKVQVSRKDARLEVASVRDGSFETIEIFTKTKIIKGVYNVQIEFRGNMTNKIRGFYRSTYKRKNGTVSTIATSKFEPTYARQAFPCFDEPNMKAKYIIHLLKPKNPNYIALSNYPAKEPPTSYDENYEIVTFDETVQMSTYLTCFIVSDFKFTSTTFDNGDTQIPLRVFASADNLEKTKYAGEIGKTIIEFYVKYFGIPYPLPKLDMVAIPDFVSGAMEHWGLVTYRETALLFTEATHSSTNKQRVATVVAHELAHSWFGNLVTMNWWNDLWLNEGFASYIEYKGVHAHHPDWEIMTQFLIEDLHRVLEFDAATSSHPIVQQVETPDQITSIFDTISYSKGASVLRMLEDTVGEVNFQKGVTNYLKKYQYANAVTANFLDEIQAAVGDTIDIYEMIDTYTVQTGYPVIDVVGDLSGNKLTLTQQRFLKNRKATFKESETKYGYKWTIPITYITDVGSKSSVTMFKHNQSSISIDLPSDVKWVKFNVHQTGYYRVNYPKQMYENLQNHYHSLNVADRTHLLEEEFSLAQAGYLSYEVPLDLSKQLSSERSYTPWSVARTKLVGLLARLEGSTSELAYKSYVRNLVSSAYDHFTWTEAPTDNHLTRLTRATVLSLACKVEHADCLKEAQNQFDNWLNGSQSISQDLRELIYRYGIREATEDTWNKLLEKYKSEIDASEKLKLVSGLSNVKNVTLLERLIELADDETIVRSQDYFTVLRDISANDMGRSLVWNWVRENWEHLVKRFTLNDRYLGSLIPTITSSFSTNERLNEMTEFFAKYPDAGAGESNRKTAIETVQNNIVWNDLYKDKVEQWVDQLAS